MYLAWIEQKHRGHSCPHREEEDEAEFPEVLHPQPSR